MKITDPEIIKSGEQELFDGITGDLDWSAIEQIFREKHKLGIEENVEYKRGDIVAHDNEVAYRLEFEVKITISVLLDREGNYLSISSSGDPDTIREKSETAPLEEQEIPAPPPDNDIGSENIDEKNEREQIDATGHEENVEMTSTVPTDKNSTDRISQTAGQAGEMMAELENENKE